MAQARTGFLLAASTIGLVWPAVAQDPLMDPTWSPGRSVYQATPEALLPQGHPAGDFLLFPSVQATALYDGNIFADDTNEEADYVALIEPRLLAQTRRDAWQFDGLLAARGSLYMDNSNQDEVEFEARGQGSYRVTETGEVNGGLALLRQVVDRSDVEEGGGTGDPRIAYRYIAGAGYEDGAGPWTYGIDGDARYSEFEDQSDKDRWNVDVAGLLAYRMSPELMPFVAPFVEAVDFDSATDRNGFDRDADRAGAEIGAEYVLGEVFTLRGAVGASRWDFADAAFDDEWVWSADALAGWNVTPVTTIKFGAGRDEINTTVNNASLKEVTTWRAGVEHAFRPNLLGFIDGEYGTTDFRDISREDDNLQLAVGGNYLLSRTWWLSAGYTYDQRDSSQPADFERSIVWLSVQANF